MTAGSTAMPAAVEATQLTKIYRTAERAEGIWDAVRGLFRPRYRDVAAVQELSLRIEEGEVVALLGPNGAGKSTAMKMLAGLLEPSSGSVQVLGFVPVQRSVEFRRQMCFVMGQRGQLSWDLPAADSFFLQATIYAVPRQEYASRLGELVELFQAADLIRRPLRELSLGERMRMELIAALLPRPRLLLLDEPTLGLDLSSQAAIRDCLRNYAKTRRVTTLLTSHYMGDVEALEARVLVINRGRLAYDGPLSTLRDRYGGDSLVSVTFAVDVPTSLPTWGEVVSRVGRSVVLRMSRRQVTEYLAIAGRDGLIAELSVRESPLEEVMSRAYEECRTAP